MIPDGTRLVFHSNRGGPEDADIYTMNATAEGPDNPAVNLTDSLRSKYGDKASLERAPSYLPDGQHITFWWFTEPPGGYRAGFTDGEIYTMQADGSHVRNLTNNNPTDLAALSIGESNRLGTQPHPRTTQTDRRHILPSRA